MNAEALFLQEGAEYFGNRLIYKNKDVGYKSESGLSLDDHGEREFARLRSIVDVEAKPVKAAAPAKVEKAEKPAKAAKAAKADPAPEPTTDPTTPAADIQSIDDLLN